MLGGVRWGSIGLSSRHWAGAVPNMNAANKRERRKRSGAPFWAWILILLACIPLALVATAKLEAHSQAAFLVFTIVAFFILNLIKTRFVTVVLVVLSASVSIRYIYWRLTETLQFETLAEMFLGTGLFMAELYAFVVLMLGFVQSIWPFHRQPTPLPEDIESWPVVDVYIPTYNESLQVVSNTVLGALSMDYPADKLRVYLLDDGRRPEFEAFAAEAGCAYITRPDNRHAKAGNLNAALPRTDGELIAIFDSDHVPTRSFLQMTIGMFLKNDNLALVQTPHHFYSPDPFERNIAGGGSVPNEGQLFYGLVQEGNDFWNAAFFCGSCAVLRRGALNDIGGFATETVTEDAHTALKMHRKGWESAYLRLPLAAGLATERLALHIGQRMRWARGMTQIFRLDNPLFGRGLTLSQRLCYLNGMLHFFFALPRFVFLTAPLAYLLFQQNIITSTWQMIFLYAFPHLFHAIFTNSRLQSRYRYTFWGEIYESVLSFHILRPTLLTLVNPRRGAFNVTEKGGLLPRSFFDTSRVLPHIVLAGILVLGLVLGVARIVIDQADLPLLGEVDIGVVCLNMFWAAFNLMLVLAAISVARERRQVREHVRVNVNLDTRLTFADGATVDTRSLDMSMGGALFDAAGVPDNVVGQQVRLDVTVGSETLPVIGQVIGVGDGRMRVRFNSGALAQQRVLVRLIFGRADAWLNWDDHKVDSFARSFWAIFRGIGGMIFGSRNERPQASRSQATAVALAAALGALVAVAPTGADAQTRAVSEAPDRMVQQESLVAPKAKAAGDDAGMMAEKPGGMMADKKSMADKMGQPADPFKTAAPPSVGTGPVKGQAEGVAGQPRPREPSRFVVPNVQLETLPVVQLPHDAPEQVQGPLTAPPGGSVETITLRSLNQPPDLRLRTVKAVYYIPFSIRTDQVVDRARLTMDFSYSQHLLPELSGLSVFLNGSPIGRLRLLRSHAGGTVLDMPINAALFKSENVLRLETDKHYTTDCEDPAHETLWLEVNTKASKLELALQPLPLVEDLALLPRPFVDPFDQDPEPLTFLLPPNPSDKVLEAAGVVASYFGDAGRRFGVEIKVATDGLGAGNTVIFVAGDQKPGLNIPSDFTGNRASVVSVDNGAKALVVSGVDDNALLETARHLVLASRAEELRGWTAEVAGPPALAERKPDDATRWIPLDRPVKLGELVERDEHLQGTGIAGFLSAPFIMPPRKLPDAQGGPTLRIEYDYPAGEFIDEKHSRMDVLFDGNFIKTVPLRAPEAIGQLTEVVRGPTDEEGRAVVRIDPSVVVAPRNEMQFFYEIKPHKKKCEGKIPEQLKLRIQPSSTLDFSDSLHFTSLPELAYFTSVGYPFTRMADLSETVVVLPAQPARDEVAAYLNLMALAGESTGDPVTRVSVARPAGLAEHPDKDVLIIGAWQNVQEPLLAWGGGGAFQFEDGTIRLTSVSPIESMRYFLSPKPELDEARAEADKVLAADGERFSGLLSFERPDASQRTVVVVAGSTPAETLALAGEVRDPENRSQFKGDLVQWNAKGLTGFAVGPQFTVHNIPPWQRLRWYFADRPLLLIALLLIGVALLSMIVFWLLQRIAVARATDLQES